jgi:hypothetical protein
MVAFKVEHKTPTVDAIEIQFLLPENQEQVILWASGNSCIIFTTVLANDCDK